MKQRQAAAARRGTASIASGPKSCWPGSAGRPPAAYPVPHSAASLNTPDIIIEPPRPQECKGTRLSVPYSFDVRLGVPVSYVPFPLLFLGVLGVLAVHFAFCIGGLGAVDPFARPRA